MKKIHKKVLALILSLAMMITMLPATMKTVNAADEFYKIVHVDAGRKYFSPENIKKIIDNSAAAGFNQVELYLSDNQGFRFALDDMNVTTSTGNTYDLTPALGDGYSDGSKYPDGSGKYLTQSEMTNIISYAKDKGIDIVPCINVPGHMGAILEEFNQFKYSGSNSSIDLENAEAVAFALAITKKYATYFKSQDVKYYNLGADEYANDLSTMGFQGLYTSGKYQKFVNFLNSAAQIVIDLGMTPRAFNDGIYYNEDNTYSINSAIQVCYWSCGWSGYNLASAQYIVNQGMDVINTHGDYYWVLGNTSWQCSKEKASQFDYTSFQYRKDTTGNGTISDPAGAMFCIWCDVGNANGTDVGTDVVSKTADVIAAFGATLPATQTDETDPKPSDPVEVTKNETVTVTVGKTATATISDHNFAGTYTTEDPSKVTVEVTGTDEVKPTTTYTQASVTCNTLISSDSDSWKAASGYYYTPDGTNYYPVYAKRSSKGFLFWYTYTYTWGYSTTSSSNNITQIGTQETDSTSTAPNITVYTQSSTAGTAASTTVTFTGVAVGTTYVTIGNTRYTINVVAEDLSKVTPLTIEYWITNVRVTGSDNSNTKSVPASEVYSENGVEFAELVPETGTANGQPDVFWKGTRLSSDNQQTTGGGVDKTTSGTDFIYIRYWNGSWSYSSNRVDWTNVVSGDQIVAYYLQKTTVTDEVTTYVVDWGPDYSDYTDQGNYVLLDFAVKYESGERVPDSFPNKTAGKKTIGFHCDTSDTNLGKVTFQDGNTYYRHLGMIKGEETADYEIYMITLTPTSDEKTTKLSGSSASANSSYSYNGTETVVWVDDENNLNTELEKHTDYHVGGEPIVPQLKIYNKQGMLVTYYVRAKVTEDSLSVHYIDQTANQEFYNYNIAVKSGTLFNENIGLASPWKGNLANGSVTNLQDKTQTVSADLSTMPAIGAQYRYSDYTCVEVVRSENGKDVYLYYTFNNAHSFVVDFGLPLQITKNDLNIAGDWTSATVSGAKHGTATATVGGGVTYTLTDVLDEVETLQLTLTGKDESVTHQIYIYPATSVYYEEGFATYSDNWTTKSENKGKIYQTTSLVGDKTLYGFDNSYLTNGENSDNSIASSNVNGSTAEFIFNGTGCDIYAKTLNDSGTLILRLYDAETNTQLKLGYVNTKQTWISNDDSQNYYNTPIFSYNDLDPTKNYKVVMTVNSGTIYFDGFRVYNTQGTTYNEVYKQDNENDAETVEVRDVAIAGANISIEGIDDWYTYGNNVIKAVYDATNDGNGAILLSNSNEYTDITVNTDMVNKGPKNEIYLKPNQAIAMNVNGTYNKLAIGMRSLNSGTVKFKLNGGSEQSLSSTVDMYYEVTPTNGNIVVYNTGNTVLALTKLKVTDFKPSTDNQTLAASISADANTVAFALRCMANVQETADATLTVKVNDQTTVLTANGIVGETYTFAASDIQAAAESLVADGYELNDVEYSDVTVAYGEEGTVEFTATKKESKPSSFLDKLIGFIKKIFGK